MVYPLLGVQLSKMKAQEIGISGHGDHSTLRWHLLSSLFLYTRPKTIDRLIIYSSEMEMKSISVADYCSFRSDWVAINPNLLSGWVDPMLWRRISPESSQLLCGITPCGWPLFLTCGLPLLPSMQYVAVFRVIIVVSLMHFILQLKCACFLG